MSDRQVRMIADFIDWCRRNNVGVVAAFPGFLDWPAYHVPPQAGFFNQVADLYRDRGVPMLGDPFDFMFPKDMFWDTPYHMHDQGADAMTALVASRLARCDVLGSSPSPGGAGCPAAFSNEVADIVMDFSRNGLPPGAASLEGFSHREDWGRWTDGPRAAVRTVAPISGPFQLKLTIAHVFAERDPLEVTVRAGSEVRTFAARRGRISLDFSGAVPSDRIEFELPPQRSPLETGASNEPRHIGIGIARIEIAPPLRQR